MVRLLLSMLCLPLCAYGIAESPYYPPKGLKNPQNGCFINASLQILHASADMMSLALRLDEYAKPGSLFETIRACERQMRTIQKPLIAIEKLHQRIYNQLGMNPFDQGDANECLVTILTRGTDDDMRKNPQAHHTYYEGTQTLKTALSELFFVHILHQRTDPNDKKFKGTKPCEYTIGLMVAVHAGDLHLKNCLDRYFGWTKEHFRTDADTLIEGLNKRFLHDTQKYLYIMLDRREAHTTKKGTNYVRQDALTSFPLEKLDLSSYFMHKERSKGLYNLIGCIMHSGNAYHGHYRAYTKIGNQWYLCNDARVQPISDETIAQIAQRGRDSAQAVVTTLVYELETMDTTPKMRKTSPEEKIFTICKNWIYYKLQWFKED